MDNLAGRQVSYGQGMKAGRKAAFDSETTGSLQRRALGRTVDAAGEKVGAAAKAFRRGIEDNPGGMGVAALGAGLATAGLTKLLGKRRQSV